MKKDVTPVGRKIQHALVDRGITQEQLAKEMGISAPTLTYVIYGVKDKYSEMTMLRILSTLNISLADI